MGAVFKGLRRGRPRLKLQEKVGWVAAPWVGVTVSLSFASHKPYFASNYTFPSERIHELFLHLPSCGAVWLPAGVPFELGRAKATPPTLTCSRASAASCLPCPLVDLCACPPASLERSRAFATLSMPTTHPSHFTPAVLHSLHPSPFPHA